MIIKKTAYAVFLFLKWWLQRESNQRHEDFQSSALPTELWSQNKWRFRRELNPRSSAWQADVITTTPRNHGCGSWIWTNGLWVMSPASYQTAPSRDKLIKWRRKRDSNPCVTLVASRFSRPVPSTRLGYSSKKWCLRPDLNRHECWSSQDFKSCASTYSATQASLLIVNIFALTSQLYNKIRKNSIILRKIIKKGCQTRKNVI